jgi:hypothetical protein
MPRCAKCSSGVVLLSLCFLAQKKFKCLSAVTGPSTLIPLGHVLTSFRELGATAVRVACSKRCSRCQPCCSHSSSRLSCCQPLFCCILLLAWGVVQRSAAEQTRAALRTPQLNRVDAERLMKDKDLITEADALAKGHPDLVVELFCCFAARRGRA